ncbi:MAG: hypothetical protein HY922_08400 [Elusimicrobia bacterium]|nr:hypothetical protein [Elusimicrobiota bacterium]
MAEFEREQETYAQNKQRLLDDGLEGQFILVKDAQILGVFASQDEAYKTGLERLGNVPMFIKRIQKDDPPDSAPALMIGLLHASL